MINGGLKLCFASILFCSGLWCSAPVMAQRQGSNVCEVSDISKHGSFNRSGQDDQTNVLFYSIAPTVDTTMSDYIRDSRGQWPLDLDVTDKSSVGLVLRTPTGPFRILVRLQIDGVPFRTFQEKGIAAAIKASTEGTDPPSKPADSPQAVQMPTVVSDDSETAESLATIVDDDSVGDDSVGDDSVGDDSVGDDSVGDDSEPEVVRVSALSYRRSQVVKKLGGYLRSQQPAATEGTVDIEELQWMVSQWLPGGRVLVATPKFGLQHVGAAHLWQLLAGDDSVISKAEIEIAESVVRAVDVNEDSIVSSDELSAARPSTQSQSFWGTDTLLQIDDFDAKVADLVVTVNISGGGGQCTVNRDLSTALANEGVQGGLMKSVSDFVSSVMETALSISSDNPDRIVTEVEFGELVVVPVCDARTGSSFFEAGQFSIGAMLLPDPLFEYVDSRPDAQLDLREISQLTGRLRELDKNFDQQITSDELPQRVMLAVSQGPWANRLLTDLSKKRIRTQAVVESAAVPTWFGGMDSNGDGLLSREEFLGNDRQFAKRDKDGDGVISSEEASVNAESSNN